MLSTNLQGGELTPTLTLSLNPNPNQVLSTNLQGGEAYELSPRMHEYCVALVSSLAPQVRAACDGVCMARACRAYRE